VSYDLSFRSAEPPSADALRAWFDARPNYEVTEQQARYDDNESGVYWSFHFTGPVEGDAVPITFDLNYFRPGYFGLAAASELTAFVEAFRLSVSDPQADGMGDGAYSAEGFLRGWNAGNASGHRAILALHPDLAPATLPAAVNAGVWRWNQAREAYMDLLGTIEMVCGFAPTVRRLRRGGEGRVYTAAIWGGGIEIALPEVDLVLALNEIGDTPRVIPLDALRELLADSPIREADHGLALDGRTWRAGLRHWLVDPLSPTLKARLAREGEPWSLEGVPPDQVLDAELVEQSRRPA
jgi:hypothetical protein